MIGQVNDDFKRVWKEAVVVYFKVLSWYLSGETEETHENPELMFKEVIGVYS
jgi:hypothetical protein